MTNIKNTKRALLSSVMAMFLCVAMLMGTTYAWFTDSVTSDNNIIQSGSLDVEMYYADGSELLTTDQWKDASVGAIFNNDKWEPGYVDARHIKIKNAGTLALSYQLRIVANGTVSKLADVIDVYYFGAGQKLSRGDLVTETPIGTLAEIMGSKKNIANIVKGTLVPVGSEDTEYSSERYLTLAFKMRENAGNEYQKLSIGTSFSIELLATQASFEEDSFGTDFDNAGLIPDMQIPTVLLRESEDLDILGRFGMNGSQENIKLDVAYQFEPASLSTEAIKSVYRYWNADLVVYADSKVPANSLAFALYYDAWSTIASGDWIAQAISTDLKAGQQVRLVELLGEAESWEEICEYGNKGIGLTCGAVDLTGVNAGTTVTVELRLYETTKAWDDASSSTQNAETGKYLTVASFEYTFPAKVDDNNKTVTSVAELQAAIDNAEGNNHTTIITFANDLEGSVTVNQKENASLIINGGGYKFNGVMTVNGNGRQNGAETLTVKNIDFVAASGAESCIVSAPQGSQNYSYAHNVSIENCTFVDADNVVDCAAIRTLQGGDMNWTVSNCTVDQTMHSLLQVANIEGKLTVNGCTVKSKNGANLNSTLNFEMNDCDFEVKGYALRFGVNSGGDSDAAKSFVVNNSTLKSACESPDDAVVILRSSAINASLQLNYTEVIGERQFIGR